MSKCRYRRGVCAGEVGLGRSVPVTGTAGEGDTLVDRVGRFRVTPWRCRVSGAGAGFHRIQFGP